LAILIPLAMKRLPLLLISYTEYLQGFPLHVNDPQPPFQPIDLLIREFLVNPYNIMDEGRYYPLRFPAVMGECLLALIRTVKSMGVSLPKETVEMIRELTSEKYQRCVPLLILLSEAPIDTYFSSLENFKAYSKSRMEPQSILGCCVI